MSSYAPVAKTSDIPVGRGKAFTVNGKRIAVFNDGENFYALNNTCAHALGSLGRGRIKMGLQYVPFMATRMMPKPASAGQTCGCK